MAIQPIPPFGSVSYETKNAFHGTTHDDAKSIWEEKKFRTPSARVEDSRFGPGVYFWENSMAAAVNWVRVYYRTSEYGIIRASVKCLSLLDLLTVEHYQVLETVRMRLAQQKGMKVEDVRHAAVLSFLSTANVIDGARLVAGAQPNSRIHPESKLAGPFEVIICVYNFGNIVVTEFIDHSTRPLVREISHHEHRSTGRKSFRHDYARRAGQTAAAGEL